MGGRMEQSGRLGATLSDLARRPEVEKALEVGTYDGEGSTFRIADGLSRTTGRLTSIEVDAALYEHARAFFAKRGLPVDLQLGLTVRPDEYLPYEAYRPRIERTAYEAESPGAHRQWYEREIAKARSAERTDLLRELVRRDGWFDLVLLDGSEYASDIEFHVVEPHVRGYFVLDDTNPTRSIKNAAAREWLYWSPDWEVVRDEPEDRCGWCVAKRR